MKRSASSAEQGKKPCLGAGIRRYRPALAERSASPEHVDLRFRDQRQRRIRGQPGSIARACDQLKTHGMARKSSMAVEFVREAGRLPIFRSEISGKGVDWRK